MARRAARIPRHCAHDSTTENAHAPPFCHFACHRLVRCAARTGTQVYAGPGYDYPRVDYLAGGQRVTLFGCLSDNRWCDVGAGYDRGWVPATNLVVWRGGSSYGLYQSRDWNPYPIISFLFGSYWNDHYRNRSWYHDRNHWNRWDHGRWDRDRNNDGRIDRRYRDRDRDGIPNQWDRDRNNDGRLDPRFRDRDRDGIPNRWDRDRNNDGRADRRGPRGDRDGDGVINRRDSDRNNDGRIDRRGRAGDRDRDGIPNRRDRDNNDG